MSKINSFLAFLSLIILRILGNHVTLNQVKASMILEDLKYELIEAIKKEHGPSILRSVLIENLNNAIKKAIYCVKTDFTAESWIAAISLIKARSPKNQNSTIDDHAYFVLNHMQGNVMEQAKLAYEAVTKTQMQALAQLENEPDLLVISEKTRQAMLKMLDEINK